MNFKQHFSKHFDNLLKCKDKDSQVHLTDEKDIVKLEKTSFTHIHKGARAFFSTKPRDDNASFTTGCFVVKTMLYWHAIFTNRGKTSELTRVWLRQRWKLLYFYDLLLKRTIDFFYLALAVTTIRIICIFQLYFFVCLSLLIWVVQAGSSWSPNYYCQIYRNKTDVQKYCSENWKKRKSTFPLTKQSHKNKYNCEVWRVNNGRQEKKER